MNQINPLEPVALSPAGNEVDTMLSTLDRNRQTFAWKCGGLDATGLSTRLAPSTLTLGGLLKHLALIEDAYFTDRLAGNGMPEAWHAYDGDDWEFRTAADDSPHELMALWRDAVARSRRAVADALADNGLDTLAAKPSQPGEGVNLRRMLADIIEEYARHTGHADLIRESIDGLVGEDAPQQWRV